MPKTFLERNKKESKWALLLLLLRWKRGVVPQLLVVMLLMLVFFAPQRLNAVMLSALDHIPLIGPRIAASIAPWMSSGDVDAIVQQSGKGSYQDMMAAIKDARLRSEAEAAQAAAARAAAAGAAGAAGANASAESTDLVRGKPEDIHGQDNIQGGASVSTVDKPGKDQSVQLGADDLQGQRASFVEAGFGAGGQGAMLDQMLAGVSPFAGRGFFSGQSGATTADNMATALGGTQVPNAHTQIVPGNGGRLSRSLLSQAALHPRAAQRSISKTGGNYAFRQLADARTRAMVSRDPNCTADNGCTPEYAMTNTGAVYDGTRVGGQGVVTTGQGVTLDGINTTASDPTGATEATLNSQADQISSDQQKCQTAEAQYKPQIDTLAGKIQGESAQMQADGCCAANGMPPGFKAGLLYALLDAPKGQAFAGCDSPAQAQQCDHHGSAMSSDCQQLDSLMLAYYNACPLMQQDGPYQHYNCVKSCSTGG